MESKSNKRNLRKETMSFVKWANKELPEFVFTPEQLEILDAYFALPVGGGKTTIARLLTEYDKAKG